MLGCGDSKTAKTVTVDRPAPTRGDTNDLDLGGKPETFKRCDANITARKGTTNCAFASNVFYEYWDSGRASAIRAYSPIAGRSFRLRCAVGNGSVVCRTNQRGVVKFPQAAVDSYSDAQARRYARSHDVGPGSTPAPPPPPPPSGPSSDSGGGTPEAKIEKFIRDDINKRSSTLHANSVECVINRETSTGTCLIHATDNTTGETGDFKADLTINSESGDVIYVCSDCPT